MPEEKQLVLSLAEGVTEGVAEEVANGVITVSENTRLTKIKGTVCRRPDEIEVGEVSVGDVCGGLITGGERSTIAYFKPGVGQKRIYGDAMETALSPVVAGAPQNAYFPYQLTQSGPVPGSLTLNTPATCYDAAGRQWFAAVRALDASFGVYVNVTQDGAHAVTTRLAAALTTVLANGTVLWCGLVPDDDDVVLFYAEDAGISARRLTIAADGMSLTIGAAVSIYAPLKPSLYARADLVGDGNGFAYLLTHHASTATSAIILKINLTTLVSSTNAVLATTTSAFFSIAYFALSYVSGGYLAYSVSDPNQSGHFGVLSASTLASMWSDVALTEYGPVAVQAFSMDGTDWLVFAAEIASSNITSSAWQVQFRRRELVAGTAAGNATLFWYALQSRGAHHRANSGETYPYFPVIPWWTTNSNAVFPTVRGDGGVPTERVIDPSVEVFSPVSYGASDFVMTCVGRFGVDRAALPILPVHNANAACISGSKLGMTYIELREDQSYIAQNGYAARYVEIDLEPTQQPGVAADYGVAALVAAALPAFWDGTETTEAAFLHTPRVVVETTGGTGPNLTGEFLVTAVITYRDSAGNMHRSAPALPYQVTLAGTKARVFVTMPNTMRNGELQEEFDITLFMSLDAETVMYAQPSYVTSKGANGGVWRFDDIRTPSDADVPLYSDGTGAQELLPQCPPPLRDVCSVGGRFWGIDAENPYAVWPSKLKQEGFAVEFAGQLRVTGFDQQYGKLVAVVDIGGVPHVLAERGVWRVGGYGPNNAGQGGRFNDPQLVSNQGCKSRASVITIPEVGVLYQAQDGRMTLLQGGGGKRFETFGPYDVCAPSVHFAESEVIYPRADGLGFVVYNWLADGWTHWPTTERVVSAVSTEQRGATQRTLFYSPTTGTVLSMESDTEITNGSAMTVTRGWVAPAGPHGDCVIREVWLHVRNDSPHDLTITVCCDYDESGATVNGHCNTVEREWTAAELTALTRDGRYTVAVTLQKPARAVKVTVSADPSGEVPLGWHPLTLMVPYGVTSGVMRRKLLAGAQK